MFHAADDAMIGTGNVVAKHRTMPGGDAAGDEQSAPQVLERLVEQAERAGANGGVPPGICKRPMRC